MFQRALSPVTSWTRWGLCAAMILIGGLALGGLTACGEEECATQGEVCTKTCPPEEVALCVAKGICECAPKGLVPIGDGGVGGSDGGSSADCRAARISDLVINEVVVDGISPDEENEFIEVVSLVDEPVFLGGIKLTGLKADKPSEVVTFVSGCFPARGAVAIFNKVENWIAPTPISGLDVKMKAFGFPNSKPFRFELLGPNGAPWSVIEGDEQMIIENVSVTRDPDLTGTAYALHRDLYGTDQSPGLCPNGGRYDRDCAPPAATDDAGLGPDGGRPDGGVPDLDGSVPPPSCDAPQLGELVINEVLVDGADPGDADEFVELLNLAAHPVSLVGVVLADGRQDPPREEVRFADGCLPPLAAVAVGKGTPETWAWSHDLDYLPTVTKSSLALANGGDSVVLLDASGDELDRIDIMGEPRVPPEGISLVRDPEGLGPFVRHDQVSALRSSPALCSNGGRHGEGCVEPQTHDAGPPTEDAGEGLDQGVIDDALPPDQGPQCDPPQLGDLVVNEALVDGVEGGSQETDEFVEIVNTSDTAVDLTGLIVRHGDEQTAPRDLVRFVSGCMPAKAAVAARRSAALIEWSTGEPFAQVTTANTRFANTRAQHEFVLVDAADQELSRLSVPKALVADGVSADRSPDLTGDVAVRHDELAPGFNQSPAHCPTGGKYVDGCAP